MRLGRDGRRRLELHREPQGRIVGKMVRDEPFASIVWNR